MRFSFHFERLYEVLYEVTDGVSSNRNSNKTVKKADIRYKIMDNFLIFIERLQRTLSIVCLGASYLAPNVSANSPFYKSLQDFIKMPFFSPCVL